MKTFTCSNELSLSFGQYVLPGLIGTVRKLLLLKSLDEDEEESDAWEDVLEDDFDSGDEDDAEEESDSLLGIDPDAKIIEKGDDDEDDDEEFELEDDDYYDIDFSDDEYDQL